MKASVNKKKRHIVLKVFLVLIIVLIIGCIGVYVWQKDNIDSAIVGMKYSQEEIADKISESKTLTEQSLKKYNLPVTRDFTLEEEEKIRKGEMTVEEALANIMAEGAQNEGEQAQVNSGGDNSNSTGEDVSTETTQTEEEKIIGRYVTEVYSLKAYYIGQLGSVEQMLKAEYIAGGRDKSKISSIISKHLGEIATMESECDSKINTLLSNMRNELVAINADTSIVTTIEDAYVSEKSLRKSYYLSQYK